MAKRNDLDAEPDILKKLPIFSTKPEKIFKNTGEAYHQLPARITMGDWKMIKVMLRREALTFQKFMSLCVRAFIEGDPNLVRCIKTYRELEMVPADEVNKGVWSNRERADIYAQLEQTETKGKNK